MAKKHFNCNDIHGLPLEYSGGEGSARYHWEATIMGYDFMTPRVSQHMLVTNITLALFEDTGWYKPDYSLAVDMWWGKARGCDFVHHANCPIGDI